MQCVAVCCSVLQCVAVCCGVLRCVAVCCSVLQCVSVMFNIDSILIYCRSLSILNIISVDAILQCTAILQCRSRSILNSTLPLTLH